MFASKKIEIQKIAMMKKRGILLMVCFAFMFVSITIGAYLKILHSPGSNALFMMGIISFFIFIIIALFEVNTSSRLNRSEKITWTIGLIFVPFIAGTLYIVSRRRIIATAI